MQQSHCVIFNIFLVVQARNDGDDDDEYLRSLSKIEFFIALY